MDDLGIGGLLGLLGFVAFGSVVPVLPTGAAVSTAAVLARDNHRWEIVLVVLSGAAGAYVGDLVMYSVLRIAGAPLAERIGWLHAEDPDGALQRMRVRLEEHEIRSFVLSRLIPAGRIPVLLAAALGGYPLARFITANVGAALAWALMYGAVGLVGNSLIPDTRIAIGVVVVAALLIGVAPRLLGHKAKPPV